MQLFNSFFVQTTFLVCAYLFLCFGSLSYAAGGIRRILPNRNKGQGSQASSNANVRSATQPPSPPPIELELLPLVLPSGQASSGEFKAETMLSLIPYKQDAIKFYTSLSESLLKEITAFVHYLDLLTREFPENNQKIKEWQRVNYPTGPLSTLNEGILYGAFQQNNLHFLSAVLGPTITGSIKINYQRKLPTPNTISFSNEMTTGLKNIWASLRAQTGPSKQISYSSAGVNVIGSKDGIMVQYSPMFNMDAVESELKEQKVVVASWKGLSLGQLKRFLQAIHDYRIIRLNELIFYTLPNPNSQTRATVANIFLKAIPGTAYNLHLQPQLVSENGQRTVNIQLQPLNNPQQYVELQANKAKSALLQQLNQLASAEFHFSTHFEKLRSTLSVQSTSLNFNVISTAIVALKQDNRLSSKLKKQFASFSITDQYHSFKATAYTFIRDYLNSFGPASTKVYGNIKYGIQLKPFAGDQLQIVYQSILNVPNFPILNTDDELVKLMRHLDSYLLYWYISDLQKILMEQKKIKISIPRHKPESFISEETIDDTQPDQRRQSQVSQRDSVSLGAGQSTTRPPRRQSQVSLGDRVSVGAARFNAQPPRRQSHASLGDRVSIGAAQPNTQPLRRQSQVSQRDSASLGATRFNAQPQRRQSHASLGDRVSIGAAQLNTQPQRRPLRRWN